MFSIVQQIRHQPQLETSWRQIQDSFHSVNLLFLIAAVCLVFVNWGIEAVKWKWSVASIRRISFWQALKAVLTGVTFSVTTPNRVGEYFGRMLYMPEGSRLKTISVTLVGSFAQMLVTLITGVVGLIVLKNELLSTFTQMYFWYQFVLYGLILLVGVLSFLYFKTAGAVLLFHRWFRHKKYLYLVEALKDFDNKLLTQVLLLSFARYAVFIVQYVLVFYLFEVQVELLSILWVMNVAFLAMAIVPSIALLEVGIRGEISLKLIGIFSANSLGIGLTSITIWFINLIVPAIVGSLLLLQIRIFQRKKANTILKTRVVAEQVS
jgi:uncharacterized membrane protein YbhN (UPF0104 family)